MSTRGSLRYLDNNFIHIHVYHEIIDDSIRMDFGLFKNKFFINIPMPRIIPFLYKGPNKWRP